MNKITVIALAITIAMLTTFTMSYGNGESKDCIGVIDSHPEALDLITGSFDITDVNVLKNSVFPKDKGGLCKGSIFKVEKPIVVYRVWNSSYEPSAKGNWWTFDKPTGTLEKFRKDYAVCCQWGPKDKMDSCTLKVGSKIVVGPGQSVDCTQEKNRGGNDCNDTRYEISEKNQVYIPDPVHDVENCVTQEWPIN